MYELPDLEIALWLTNKSDIIMYLYGLTRVNIWWLIPIHSLF